VKNDLRTAVVQAFGLGKNDDYVYHATASVNLAQVQLAIDYGDANGMHAWYRDDVGHQVIRESCARGYNETNNDIHSYRHQLNQILKPIFKSSRTLP
jgi:hypothetical protein